MNKTLPNSTLQTAIPGDLSEKETTNDIHPAIQYLFIAFYGIVFLSGFFGNIIIVLSVYKFKRMRTVVNIFLVNLALADLLFVILSIFDGLAFLRNEWVFGDFACRLQSTLIEVSYTVSVCTLTVVAFERYMSICHPHKLKRTFKQAIKVCGMIWLFGVLFCACLFYGYSARPDKHRVMQCRNDNWSDSSRLSFYVIHSIIVYLVPLTIMCCSHINISRVLIEQKVKTGVPQTFTAINKQEESSDDSETNNKPKEKVTAKVSTASTNHLKYDTTKQKQKTVNRRMKIVRLLVVVTTIFFLLWTPFIFVRFIQYINVKVNQMLWRASQLLIFGNTAVNCFIYALMSPAFRTAFKGLFMCSKTLTMKINGINNSKSFDLSETLKKQSTLTRSAQRINRL